MLENALKFSIKECNFKNFSYGMPFNLLSNSMLGHAGYAKHSLLVCLTNAV